MKVTFKGERTTPDERKLIQLFTMFVLEMFCSKQTINRVNIVIDFVHPEEIDGADRLDLISFKAWMTREQKYKFTIVINSTMLYKSTNLLHRVKHTLECIGHELIHIKQYLNNELRDYTNGDVWYNGNRYKKQDWEDEDKYWFMPWEIEAYGYENGLFAVFKNIFTK